MSRTILILQGKMSVFGGPHDTGVSRSEGLALVEPNDLKDPNFAGLFLSEQPPGTTGLARRLNPKAHYIACRWQYSKTPRGLLQKARCRLTNMRTGKVLEGVRPVDWGPNENTGRVADLSQGAADDLDLKTDDMVKVEVMVD